MNAKSKKSPLGLIPKWLHDEQRFDDVRAAIERYFKARLKIPNAWVEEYNQFVEKQSDDKKIKQ